MHGNIDKKILTKNFLVIFIVNTNENILLLYIKKITIKIEKIKNKLIDTMTCHLYIYNYCQIELVGEIHP
jgi:hypothetical protein